LATVDWQRATAASRSVGQTMLAGCAWWYVLRSCMHVRGVGTREGGDEEKGRCKRTFTSAGHARARGNFTDMQQVQLLPFDAAEDERSGCETLCSFVGRRRSGRA
jgi:hypothetical protein